MTRIHIAIRAILLSGVGLAASAAAVGAQSIVDPIWNDPVFKKQFIAGYGINADVEPRVTQAEVAILEKIRPIMAEDLSKAESTLREQMKPECSAILDFTLGGIQFQQDKFPAALENYLKAVGKFPSFRRAWRNLGLIHARNGNYADAIRAFTRMIELGGGDGYAYGLLGSAYAAQQDYQPSEVAYRSALLLQPDNTEWRLGLTRCVFKQEKYQDAATLLDALIARYPDKSEFWLLQAHTFLGMKQPLKAAQNLEVIDRLGKATIDSMHTLGDIYVSEGLLDLAVLAYRRAIDVDVRQPVTRPLRAAELLAARGATAHARAVAARIEEVYGGAMDAAERLRLLKLSARLSMAEGLGSEEASKVLEEIVKLDPLDGEALMLLGQHHARLNAPDRAIFYFERAASIEAFEAQAKIRQAQVLVGMNRFAEALPLLRRAKEIKPRDEIARYLEQVERVAKARR